MRIRLRFIVPLLGTMALLFGLAPSASADMEQWWLKYKESGNYLCLTISGASTADNALLVESTCAYSGNTQAAQEIRLLGNNPTYMMNIRRSNKCLDGYDGWYVRQLPCTGGTSQYWHLDFISSDQYGGNRHYLFRNAQTNLCMTGSSLGAYVLQTTCSITDIKQNWWQGLEVLPPWDPR